MSRIEGLKGKWPNLMHLTIKTLFPESALCHSAGLSLDHKSAGEGPEIAHGDMSCGPELFPISMGHLEWEWHW